MAGSKAEAKVKFDDYIHHYGDDDYEDNNDQKQINFWWVVVKLAIVFSALTNGNGVWNLKLCGNNNAQVIGLLIQVSNACV